MKIQIKQARQVELTSEDVSPFKFYGCIYAHLRCPIQAFKYTYQVEAANYRVICLDGFTYLNGYHEGNLSLKELIARLVETTEVYQFDTAKELFKWLGE